MSILICDPSLPHHVMLRFADDAVDLHQPKADELLRAMDRLIAGRPWQAIRLVNQASSFTLIRVLATMANALAYSRGLQLYDGDQLVEKIIPHYDKAPHITLPAHGTLA